MNNPLVQKYQYYLSESNRLSEELKSEEEYSELLENVLLELLGEEDFTKLFEYVMRGTVTRGPDGKPLSPERSARRAKRIAQIVDIGRTAAQKGNKDLQQRAAQSLLAKGAGGGNIYDALGDNKPITIEKDDYKPTSTRFNFDYAQKERSKQRRREVEAKIDKARNTF